MSADGTTALEARLNRLVVEDSGAPPLERQLSLSALLLMDETQGLEELTREMLVKAPAGPLFLSFAGCSAEGRRALVLFSLTCPAPLPEDTRQPVVELIDSIVDNRSTRAAALMLLARLHKADSALPPRYASRLIKLARQEPEPLHFADLIHAAAFFSEGGFDPSFPFDPSSYSDSDQRAAAARWIEARRQEVQAKADAWVRGAEDQRPRRSARRLDPEKQESGRPD